MKSIKDGCERLIQKIYETRGIIVRTPVTHKDYDYWDLQDEDFIHNPIIGFTSVGHIRELQRRGVISYQKGAWRIPIQECLNYKGEKRFRPTDLYFEYRKNKFRLIKQCSL